MPGSDGLYRGNSLSKILGLASVIPLVFGITRLIALNWVLAISGIVLHIAMVYISYRLASGRRNPVIWEGRDLYDLLHAMMPNKLRIGFHSSRDQRPLLDRLESVGIVKAPYEDSRSFIRDKVLMDRRAFDICRDYIIAQTVYNGKEHFWDGYGNRRTAQYFHEAEIIFSIDPSVGSILVEALGNPEREH